MHPNNFGSFAPDHSVTTAHFGMKDPAQPLPPIPWQTCMDKWVMNPSGDVLFGSRHNTYLLIWIQSIQEGMVQIIGPWCKTKVMAFLKAKLTGSRMQCACVSIFSFWLNSRCRLISHDVWHCFPKVVQELLHRLQLTTHQLCTIYCKALDIAFLRQSAGRTSHSHACVALG